MRGFEGQNWRLILVCLAGNGEGGHSQVDNSEPVNIAVCLQARLSQIKLMDFSEQVQLHARPRQSHGSTHLPVFMPPGQSISKLGFWFQMGQWMEEEDPVTPDSSKTLQLSTMP